MILKINPGNIEVMCLFGLKFLFDGYLMNHANKFSNLLIKFIFLFDGYLILT